jgi:phytanoyl-CoA hydroxylase
MNSITSPSPQASAPGSSSARAAQFEEQGYVLVKQLFSPAEVEELKERFTQIHRDGAPGFYEPSKITEAADQPNDPLNVFPRVSHPHRFDPLSFRAMIHPAVASVLTEILGEEPYAVQTMYYFKPPGARGQEMHQDQFYLMVEPGTCVAAWTAIDHCDAENGAMMVVPKTNHSEVACPETADSAKSFTKHYVRPPVGSKPLLLEMEPGDTLFFNGSTIHGSGPNRTKDRFRRAFISHYATGNAESISKWYKPSYRMNGEEVVLADNPYGGACGESWHGGLH